MYSHLLEVPQRVLLGPLRPASRESHRLASPTLRQTTGESQSNAKSSRRHCGSGGFSGPRVKSRTSGEPDTESVASNVAVVTALPAALRLHRDGNHCPSPRAAGAGGAAVAHRSNRSHIDGAYSSAALPAMVRSRSSTPTPKEVLKTLLK